MCTLLLPWYSVFLWEAANKHVLHLQHGDNEKLNQVKSHRRVSGLHFTHVSSVLSEKCDLCVHGYVFMFCFNLSSAMSWLNLCKVTSIRSLYHHSLWAQTTPKFFSIRFYEVTSLVSFIILLIINIKKTAGFKCVCASRQQFELLCTCEQLSTALVSMWHLL